MKRIIWMIAPSLVAAVVATGGLLDRVDLVQLGDRLADFLLGRIDLSLARADGRGDGRAAGLALARA